MNEVGIVVYLKSGCQMQLWFESEFARKVADYLSAAVNGELREVLRFGDPVTCAIQPDQVIGFVLGGRRSDTYASAVAKVAATLEKQTKLLSDGEEWKE